MAGEILKKRREDLGRDIRDIADLLKINAAYLDAIENDALAELPAPVYTMGYIRCYAKYLDVDAESIIEYYTKNLSHPGHTTIVPVAFSRRKVPRLYFVVFFGVVASAFLFFVLHGGTKSQEAAKAPQKNVRVVGTVPLRASRAPAVNKDHAIGEHSLQLKATATTWISIKFADGRTEEMLLQPGSSKGLRFSDKAILKVGNAGGIRVGLDDRDLGVPGKPGQVITLSLPSGEAVSAVTSP